MTMKLDLVKHEIVAIAVRSVGPNTTFLIQYGDLWSFLGLSLQNFAVLVPLTTSLDYLLKQNRGLCCLTIVGLHVPDASLNITAPQFEEAPGT